MLFIHPIQKVVYCTLFNLYFYKSVLKRRKQRDDHLSVSCVRANSAKVKGGPGVVERVEDVRGAIFTNWVKREAKFVKPAPENAARRGWWGCAVEIKHRTSCPLPRLDQKNIRAACSTPFPSVFPCFLPVDRAWRPIENIFVLSINRGHGLAVNRGVLAASVSGVS